MKKVIMYLLVLGISVCTVASAQENEKGVRNSVKKTGKTIKKGAKKAGNKTAEIGSKGVAKVVDRTYDGKVAPNGRTVYITEDSRYYWVNNKGKRIYVQEHQLKNKQ